MEDKCTQTGLQNLLVQGNSILYRGIQPVNSRQAALAEKSARNSFDPDITAM
ncbi:MAG: hypothetical protein KDA78_12765 [Planctomycetaceae bacterium]|nr:hypothetical protein [Planctomycetaceae bacterium]